MKSVEEMLLDPELRMQMRQVNRVSRVYLMRKYKVTHSEALRLAEELEQKIKLQEYSCQPNG